VRRAVAWPDSATATSGDASHAPCAPLALDRREHARMHAHWKQHHAQQPDAVQPEAQRRQQHRRDIWNPARISVA